MHPVLYTLTKYKSLSLPALLFWRRVGMRSKLIAYHYPELTLLYPNNYLFFVDVHHLLLRCGPSTTTVVATNFNGVPSILLTAAINSFGRCHQLLWHAINVGDSCYQLLWWLLPTLMLVTIKKMNRSTNLHGGCL